MTAKKCLVFETLNNICNTMQIVEAENSKEIRLTGIFGVAGVKNNNNRIYDKQNYGLMVESLQKTIATEGCLGELEHPNSMNINLNNVSHKIESIVMNEDGTVTGTIVLLDTDKGRNAQAIVRAGVPLYISSRAAGSIDESGHVTLTSLKTYDLVGTPGFSQAKLNLAENQKFESLNESLCIIYESDDNDDLLSDDEDDKKEKKKEKDSDDHKEDDKKKSDDDSKEDKKDKEDNEDDKDDSSDDSKKDKEDNNKNNDKEKVTMQDLNKSIEDLSKKIDDLQADLHIAKESLKEKEGQIKMLKEQFNSFEMPKVNYSAIQQWVEEEFAPYVQDKILTECLKEMDKSLDDANQTIKKWTVSEFAPEIQNWVTEEFAPEIQGWVTEEFAPEIQGWVTEEFAPEIQGWITEEFAPTVEGWITEEFAPTVEGWINEELLPVVDNWINEECLPEHKDMLIEQIAESKNHETLSNIDNLLEAIENKGAKDEALELLKEAHIDTKYKGVYVIENMPSQYAPQWEMASESKKEDIIRRSKMYNFAKPGVLESFWNTVDFKENEQITESVKPEQTYHSNIFAQMARLRKNG